ncbi:hypothetical protein B0A54_10187 [Friedmanniomyces endolithicus]|uniref:Uncharacterized protein n=1 Tax=Friedmanniomyces endolithicus TaxID=329885 RepID=A0A4U0UU73_9PEZI|nr:hypothetical protein LTS09_003956 [Friedmanniomyces endolithicus]TKA39631.1 hypothetical protein B0A54_10187 [Friedmanniomyces endolithicus]
MYRTTDPRFRRRLNEIGQSVENATEQAQSGLYHFGQSYIRPCLGSVGSCFTDCVDAGCPSLNLSQRDRTRRQRGQTRGRVRAELSFDFYDDWDDQEETDGLLGWGGNDELDRLLAGSGAGGYGTVAQQPGRQRGMTYPKGRRKSAAQIEADATATQGSKGFFGRVFGGKALKYTPSAASLEQQPRARRKRLDRTEGDALLAGDEHSAGTGAAEIHGRKRSATVGSGATSDSYSSRGDIFPSDEEDAIPLDDEFAMVLERRNTQSGPETESSSGRTRSERRGKRPSVGSRNSTRRTVSSRSTRSSQGRKSRSRAESLAETPIAELAPEVEEEVEVEVPTLNDLKLEERQIEHEEEAEVERKRQEAQRLAEERGLHSSQELPSKDDTPESSTPTTGQTQPAKEPSQLPTPMATDDEEDTTHQLPGQPATAEERKSGDG